MFCLLLVLVGLKRTQTKRNKCEERYKIFIDSSDEGVVGFELKKPMSIKLPIDEQIEWIQKYAYFSECNSAMVKMCGKNMVGETLIHPLTKNSINEIMLKAFISNKYNLHNLESVEKIGDEVKTYLVSLFGVFEKGKLVRGWGRQKDISKTKKYEVEREKLLKETQDAKDVAFHANKEKDKVLADISHELRTSLVSIVGYAELLSDDSSKKDLKKGLEVIKRNGKAQLTLIEDLLSVAQARSGKSKLHKEVFNLKDVLLHRIESLKYKYEAKNLSIIFKNVDLEVFADQIKVGQIFTNLFSNAIKFTDSGTIEVGYGKTSNKSFYFYVKDMGIGIEKNNFKKLFSPYYQVDNGVTKAKTGIGLGLYIVKTFTNLHKGRIEVESELGKGSKFTVHLPLNGNDLRELNKSLDGMHILLAEDDDSMAEIITITLEKEGSVVSRARNAEEVRNLLKSDVYDLYVFDIAMPKEDGITLIKSIRELGDTTRAVGISAYGGYEEEALSGGFNMFMLKPVNIKNLL